MGALSCFWNAPEVEIHAKWSIYMAILSKLLFTGLKILGNHSEQNEKLEAFHLRYIRRILDISWDSVRESKISNIQVKWFNNFENIELQIARRRLTFLGKL